MSFSRRNSVSHRGTAGMATAVSRSSGCVGGGIVATSSDRASALSRSKHRSSAQESSSISNGGLGLFGWRFGEGASAATFPPFSPPFAFAALSNLTWAFGRAWRAFCLLACCLGGLGAGGLGGCCGLLPLPFPLELELWPLGLPLADIPFAPWRVPFRSGFEFLGSLPLV